MDPRITRLIEMKERLGEAFGRVDLVVRLPNWIGDVVLALPALELLVRTYGERVAFVGRQSAAELVRWVGRGQAHIFVLGGAPKGFRMLHDAIRISRLGARKGLLLAPSFSSALLFRLAGLKEVIGWATDGRGTLLTRPLERAPRGSRHLADEYVDLARAAGASGDVPPGLLRLDRDWATIAEFFLGRAQELGSTGNEPLVAVAPGAAYGPAKRWPEGHFRALIEDLSRRGIAGMVVGSESEYALGERLVEGVEGWINAAGIGTAGAGVELLRLADVAVSNDSGALHMASAAATVSIGLFGSTDPGWTVPRTGTVRILKEDFECSPCFQRKCPRGDPAPCMAALEPSEVAEEVLELLGERRGLHDPPSVRPAGRPGRPAIFLDRDGTLIEAIEYLHEPERVRLANGVGRAIARANEAGYAVVVVTNQAGIARGYYGLDDAEATNRRVVELVEQEGGHIEAVYVCPHHPDFTGYCTCRKPRPGMLIEAAMDFGIDLGRSWMIGDTVEDIEAGRRAGVRVVLVGTGYGATAAAKLREAGLPFLSAPDATTAIEMIVGSV